MAYTLSAEDVKRCRLINARHKDRVKEIALAVAAETSLPISAIYGPSRVKHIVLARQMVMYLAHLDGLSYPAIGTAMNRDHTTIMDAVKREKARRALETETPTD